MKTEKMKMKETGNGRLIYMESLPLDINIAKVISSLDEAIESSPKLQLANEVITIAFEYWPSQEQFLKTPIKIGREIIGFDSDIKTKFQVTDFDNQKVWCCALRFGASFEHLFQQVAERMAEHEINPKSSWKLKLTDKNITDLMMEIYPFQ